MVSQKRGDVTNDVEIQDERPLVAVHEVNRLGPPNLEHPEVNEIIADGVLRVINPAHGGASLGALEPQHVIDLVEKEVPLSAELIGSLSLEGLQIVAVLLGVFPPIGVALVEDLGVGAVLGGVPAGLGNIGGLLDLLLLALAVRNSLLNFLGLDVVAKLLFHLLAEALQNTATVVLEGLIHCRISRRQGDIALLHDVVAGQDAGDGSRAQQDRRRIQLGELDAGLDVSDSQILLAVLVGVGLAGVGHAVLARLVDGADRVVGLLDDLAGLGRGLASQNGACDGADDAQTHKDLRALPLELKADLMDGSAQGLHDFVLFHG